MSDKIIISPAVDWLRCDFAKKGSNQEGDAQTYGFPLGKELTTLLNRSPDLRLPRCDRLPTPVNPVQ
jgi:hypothetical protein